MLAALLPREPLWSGQFGRATPTHGSSLGRRPVPPRNHEIGKLLRQAGGIGEEAARKRGNRRNRTRIGRESEVNREESGLNAFVGARAGGIGRNGEESEGIGRNREESGRNREESSDPARDRRNRARIGGESYVADEDERAGAGSRPNRIVRGFKVNYHGVPVLAPRSPVDGWGPPAGAAIV